MSLREEGSGRLHLFWRPSIVSDLNGECYVMCISGTRSPCVLIPQAVHCGSQDGGRKGFVHRQELPLARVWLGQLLAEERTRICRSWCITVFSVSEAVLSVAAAAFRGLFPQFSAVHELSSPGFRAFSLFSETCLGGFIRNEPLWGVASGVYVSPNAVQCWR